MTIIKRTTLGRPLTWQELDDNFSQVDGLVTQAAASVNAATTQAQAAAQSAAQAQAAAGYKDFLQSNDGATGIGTANGDTVQEHLDQLESIYGKKGFSLIGHFLNVNELKSATGLQPGTVVNVISAASTSENEQHVGGGVFVIIDNVNNLADDGGVVVSINNTTYVACRINFTLYDIQFWGVKTGIPSGTTAINARAVSNAAAITLATNYARANRIILQLPKGDILTSEMVPIYNNMGICGYGKAENTVFYKTTNNAFPFKNGTTTVTSVDALVGFVPNKYDRADFSMESFCVHGRVENCMFRRYGLTQANVATIRPQVGMYLNKAASPVIRQASVEGAYIGIQAHVGFSGVMEMVSATQYNGYGYAGIQFTDFRGGVLYSSGTSMDMRLVQCRGYQFGFDLTRLQYTTMTNCTAEEVVVQGSDTTAYAFNITDPYCVIMNTCATEFVHGGQIRVSSFSNPSFVRSLTVNGFIAIDQQTSLVSTPIFSVDSAGIGALKVTFVGGELSRDTTKANNAAPVVTGLGAKVVVINAGGEDWTQSVNGVFTRLA